MPCMRQGPSHLLGNSLDCSLSSATLFLYDNALLVGCLCASEMQAQIDFLRLEVRRTATWVWQLHENQSYLGRCVLRLRREFLGSLAELAEDEWLSLRHEMVLYERIIREIFKPDRFNYGQLGNVFPQLHVHAVPRYQSERAWGGVTFIDHRWGSNWAPNPESPLAVSRGYELAKWLRDRVKTTIVGQP